MAAKLQMGHIQEKSHFKIVSHSGLTHTHETRVYNALKNTALGLIFEECLTFIYPKMEVQNINYP